MPSFSTSLEKAIHSALALANAHRHELATLEHLLLALLDEPDAAELYGIFTGGWDYLFDQISNRTAPWIDNGADVHGIERTVNDLVEKSIRNFEIRERWKSVAVN